MADIIGRILDKAGAIVNVQHPDFGAQGNFTGDAGTAIQSAINFVSGSGGGTVYIPPGTYRIATTIQPAQNVNIVGAGRQASVLKVVGAIWAMRRTQATEDPLHITIADLMFKGDGSATSGSGVALGGVNLERCNYVEFYNCTFDSFSATNGKGLALGRCLFTVIDRCLYQYCHTNCVFLYTQSGLGCNQTAIKNCELFCSSMPSCTALYVNGAQNVLVTGCDFEGGATPSASVGIDVSQCDGVMLIGNYIENFVAHAIRAANAAGGNTRVVVEGNKLHSQGGGPVVDLNNAGVAKNARWILRHNRIGDVDMGAICIASGNSQNTITFANDTDSDANILDTPTGPTDNAPGVRLTGTDPAWDPPSISAGAVTTRMLTIPGALPGDPVSVGFSTMGTNNLSIAGHVQAPSMVRVVLMNHGTSSINLAQGILKVLVWKQ